MDTQLLAAAQNGKTADIEALIANGANIKVQDKHGYMPLHWAVYTGHFDTASTLLAAGEPVNAQTHRGWSALHVAAQCNRVQLGCLLLDHGAYLSAKDKMGLTPLSPSFATPEFISTLSLQKNQQDGWVQQNERTIATIGSRIHLKVKKSLQEQRDEITVKMEQQKSEMLAAQVLALKDIQKDLQGQIDNLQQQYSNNKEDDNDQEEHPAKRQKRPENSVCPFSAPSDCCAQGLCGPRLAACEEEIAALREMIMGEKMDTMTEAANLDTGVKIKMEDTSEEDTTYEASTPPNISEDDNDDALLAAKEQELQGVRAELEASQNELQDVRTELEASQTLIQKYQEKCVGHEENMKQLRKLITGGPEAY